MLAPLSTNWYITTMHRFDTYASRFEIDEHERVHKLGRHVLACATNPQIELMRQLMDEQPKHLLAPLAIRAVQGEPLHETYPLMGATLAEHKRAIQHQLDDGKMTAGAIVDIDDASGGGCRLSSRTRIGAPRHSTNEYFL